MTEYPASSGSGETSESNIDHLIEGFEKASLTDDNSSPVNTVINNIHIHNNFHQTQYSYLPQSPISPSERTPAAFPTAGSTARDPPSAPRVSHEEGRPPCQGLSGSGAIRTNPCQHSGAGPVHDPNTGDFLGHFCFQHSPLKRVCLAEVPAKKGDPARQCYNKCSAIKEEIRENGDPICNAHYKNGHYTLFRPRESSY